MDLAEPGQWNGYTYANSSPVTLSDPDGLDPCPGGGGGCYYDGTTTRLDGVTPQQMAKGREETQRALKRLGTPKKPKKCGWVCNRKKDVKA